MEEEKKKAKVILRKPDSIPLFGRLLCLGIPIQELYTKSGLQLPARNKDLVVVAVSNQVESQELGPGCTVTPFNPPTHDGGRIEIKFQTVSEYDHNGRHDYIIVYESELASFVPKEKIPYEIEIVKPEDYIPQKKSDIIIATHIQQGEA